MNIVVINEHVIINFLSFISKLSITNMYIQNPPIHLQEQIKRAFGDLNIIEEIPQIQYGHGENN